MVNNGLAKGIFLASGLVIFLSFGPAAGQGPKWTPTFADTLRKDILRDYDPTLRPSQYYNVTTVETGITLTHVEINELKSIFSVYGWMKFQWNDSRLAWEPMLYGNTTKLYLNQTVVWTPSAEASNILVKVTSDGILELTNSFQKQTKCSIQWQRWPFDTQHCKMLFSPWIELDMEVHVSLMKNNIEQGTMWSLSSVTLETHAYKDENVSLHLKGTHLHCVMKRNSAIYSSTIIAPACVLVLMNLIGFWLPPTCGEKLVLNAINLLVTSMFLIHFNETISYYTNNTPSIVLFYSQSAYLSCGCLLLTVAIECMLKNKSKVPVHPVVKKIISIEAILCMITTDKKRYQNNNEVCETLEEPIVEQSGNDLESATNSDQDWLLFATLLTRVAFIIYVILFFVMILCHF
ncbi:5-hydroxytryptamine receptor 3A-like isoform X2 [Anopheles bellator]|uniref:5-hydroxytryptamine receptor 3A-like isoform X2 n=1 Tax=Anopheles bellator TaxID=139047 RepID=UPI002648EB9F|nr:5-hydroxytryptamine receptor 3A-like isoform X2 [Anopheles bellator]